MESVHLFHIHVFNNNSIAKCNQKLKNKVGQHCSCLGGSGDTDYCCVGGDGDSAEGDGDGDDDGDGDGDGDGDDEDGDYGDGVPQSPSSSWDSQV